MTWEGYNYEDAVLLSERLVQDDVYTSIHIEEYECEARDTKLGPEEITRDVPGVGEEALKDLDDRGIIRIGAEVRAGDILVGKVTPKGETELTPEERLLRAIFGEKAREVRDTSLKVPHGAYGIIVDAKVFTREAGDELGPGADHEVLIAQNHSPEDDEAFMVDVLRYFKDPRYIRIQGRPLFLVYRPGILPDMQGTLSRWKAVCARHGESVPYFVMCISYAMEDFKKLGFDAAVQFPPHAPWEKGDTTSHFIILEKL